MKLALQRPWLVATLPERRRMLSWSLTSPGFAQARRIVWREVRNADLPPELDARRWLAEEAASAGYKDCVCMLTSRDVGSYAEAAANIEGMCVAAAATVGLSNAERVGARQSRPRFPGTINIAVSIDSPLSDGAMIEALSLVAEARTLAVLEAGLPLASGLATGTGTDCIVVAAPSGEAAYAGKHTPLGEAIGEATLTAMRQGVRRWTAEREAQV